MTVPGVVLGARPLCATLRVPQLGQRLRMEENVAPQRRHLQESCSYKFLRSIFKKMDTKPLIDNTSKLHFSQGLSCPGGCFVLFSGAYSHFCPNLPMSAVISGVLWANSGLPPQNTGTVCFYPCSLDREPQKCYNFYNTSTLPESDGRNINAKSITRIVLTGGPPRVKPRSSPHPQGVQAGRRLESHHHPETATGLSPASASALSAIASVWRISVFRH